MKNEVLVLTVLLLFLFGCSIAQTKPDLTISNISYDGVANSVKVKVLNEGSAASKSFLIEVYEGETLLGSTEVVGIGKAGQFTATVSGVSLSSGSHTIQAIVDPQNLISESNEQNNELEKTFMGGEDTQTPQTPEEIDLQKLIERGKNQPNVHYKANVSSESFGTDMVLEGIGELWQKNGSIKTVVVFENFLGQSNVTFTTIEKGEFSYVKNIDPSSEFEWTAYKTIKHTGQGRVGTFKADSYLSLLEKIENAVEVEIIGQERVGTRDTVVVEFVENPLVEGAPPMWDRKQKVWLDIESGIPLKREILSENSKSTEQVTEIDFEPVDDSVFEVTGKIDDRAIKIGSQFFAHVYTYKEGVVDEGGSLKQVPLEGALVELSSVLNSDSWTCITDENGKCTIEDFKAGEYNSKVTKEGCEDNIQENLEARTGVGFHQFLMVCEDYPF